MSGSASGTGGDGGTDADVRDNLTCPICLEIPDGEVYQCVNGHTICGGCVQNAETCPQCRVSFSTGKIRNRAMESLVAGLKEDCPFKDAGCLEVVRRRDLAGHLGTCSFKLQYIQLCKVMGFDCEHWCNNSKPDTIIDHFLTTHSFVKRRGPKLTITMEDISGLGDDANDSGCTLLTPIIMGLHYKRPNEPDARTVHRRFFILSQYHGYDHSISWFTLALGDPKDVEQVEVQFTIMNQTDQVPPLKWRLNPIPIVQSYEMFPFTPYRIPMPLLIKHYINPENSTLQFTFNVERVAPQLSIKDVTVVHAPPEEEAVCTVRLPKIVQPPQDQNVQEEQQQQQVAQKPETAPESTTSSGGNRGGRENYGLNRILSTESNSREVMERYLRSVDFTHP